MSKPRDSFLSWFITCVVIFSGLPCTLLFLFCWWSHGLDDAWNKWYDLVDDCFGYDGD